MRCIALRALATGETSLGNPTFSDQRVVAKRSVLTVSPPDVDSRRRFGADFTDQEVPNANSVASHTGTL